MYSIIASSLSRIGPIDPSIIHIALNSDDLEGSEYSPAYMPKQYRVTDLISCVALQLHLSKTCGSQCHCSLALFTSIDLLQ